MMWFWFSLAIALLVVELVTTQLVSIWLSASSFVTGIIVAIFSKIEIPWQILIFAVLSTIALFATRPFVRKFTAKSKDNKTNIDLNIGKNAIVTEKIDNINGQGTIKINGLIWSARSDDGNIIEEGEIVIFKEISGNKAIVSANK